MTASRLLAIGMIFGLAAFAWFVLGGSVELRTGQKTDGLSEEVGALWGQPQVQKVPTFSAVAGNRKARVDLSGSDVSANFRLDQRRKGLLWYATYVTDFSATYRVSNPSTASADAEMTLTFPDPNGLYDGFGVSVDGAAVPIDYRNGSAVARFRIPAGATSRVATGYKTNGMDTWAYDPSPEGASIIKDFKFTAVTDFVDVDYPADGVSPSTRTPVDGGWRLVWDYDSVVSGQSIGIVMPSPTNPGPLVSRITFFAPVSLLFFFAALILLTATSSVRLHPVHYGFLAAAFFAFHLLLAYLADQIDLNLAFVIAATTSVALVLGYLRVVVGANRALWEIGASQFVFLVLFSYSFFFEGITGLAITIGSVLTLAFFMVKTARVDWESVFVRRERLPQPPVPAPSPAE